MRTWTREDLLAWATQPETATMTMRVSPEVLIGLMDLDLADGSRIEVVSGDEWEPGHVTLAFRKLTPA